MLALVSTMTASPYSFDDIHQVLADHASQSPWLLHLDILVCLITTVCIIGTFIAVFTEDSGTDSTRWSFTISEMLPMHLTQFLKSSLEETVMKAHRSKPPVGIIGGNTTNSPKVYYEKRLTRYEYFSACKTEFLAALCQGSLMSLLVRWTWDFCSRMKLRIEILYCMYNASSRRHMIYLMEKKMINSPIKKNETEQESYITAKRTMQVEGTHLFSWQFDNVSRDKILCDGLEVVPISSYSYLDLIRSSKVQEAAIEAAKLYATGNHGPRMLGGNNKIICDLEYVVAKFFYREKSLICATGYLACMSGISAVCSVGDLIVTDSRNHASLQSGFRISGAKVKTFSHNDFYECEKILKKFRHQFRECWIVIESVYSMDGDIGDLPSAKALANTYNCKIMIDEAHGLGVLGKNGRGLEEHFDMVGTADLIVGTFSKSIAGVGGFVCGMTDLVDFLDFHMQGNVFSAPLTAYSCGGAIKAFNLITGEEIWRVKKLQDNILFFREALISGMNLWPADFPDELKYIVGGTDNAAVIPIIFRDDFHRLFLICKLMKEHGYFTAAVVYPACPARFPRFRITATAGITREIMQDFTTKLVNFTIATPISPMISLINAL